jgi:Cysteine rich repeat
MRIAIASIILLAAGTSIALAHPRGDGAVREACRADAVKYCQGIRPGDGRIRACLKSNRDRLSEECKSAVTKAVQAWRERK